MGLDKPWDELNYMPTAGLNYGFPFCYGNPQRHSAHQSFVVHNLTLGLVQGTAGT